MPGRLPPELNLYGHRPRRCPVFPDPRAGGYPGLDIPGVVPDQNREIAGCRSLRTGAKLLNYRYSYVGCRLISPIRAYLAGTVTTPPPAMTIFIFKHLLTYHGLRLQRSFENFLKSAL